MSLRATLPLACAVTALLAASAGHAGEVACWFENGAVVVPAQVGGIAGDWILDPSQPTTLLHETRAEMEGLSGSFIADGHIAGERLTDLQVTVADLDDRAPGFVTPIAGVLGADVLQRFVVDLDVAPCRIRFSAERPPAFPRSRVWRLERVGGAAAVRAAISDDRVAHAGLFAVDWGSRASVRPSGAAVSPVIVGIDRTRRNSAPARLRALSIDGRLYEEQTAAVAVGLDPGLAGTIGTDFWARWRIRLDLARNRMMLSPK